jgi:hypothetical protein
MVAPAHFPQSPHVERISVSFPCFIGSRMKLPSQGSLSCFNVWPQIENDVVNMML